MKKYTYFDGAEMNSIYTELPECFGCKYIMQTSGDPVTDEDYDEEGNCMIDEIEAAIAENAETETEATEEDSEYVMGLAEAWGIA